MNHSPSKEYNATTPKHESGFKRNALRHGSTKSTFNFDGKSKKEQMASNEVLKTIMMNWLISA